MEAAQSTFISSTTWTERIGPTAAIATIEKHEREGVAQQIVATGKAVQEGWADAARSAGLEIDVSGLASLPEFSIRGEQELELSTLFTQCMLQRGFLAFSQFKPSLAHEQHHVSSYLDAVAEVFRELREARERGDVRDRLNGPPARRGFYRLT